MLIFLCCCLLSKSSDPVDPAISEWAASRKGHTSYQDLKEGLLKEESPQRTMLRLLALLSFQRLHPSCTLFVEEQSWWLRGCHLFDYGHHLDGGMLASRDSLRQMAHSLWHVVGGECCSRTSLFFHRIEGELPKQPLDIFADIYWCYKIKLSRDHWDAWTRTFATKMQRNGGEVTVSREASQRDVS